MAERKRKSASHTSPTITDVARRAGVSRTPVSYVFNDQGQRNKHVSYEDRAKGLQAVQELHFHPDALARALRRGPSAESGLSMGNAFERAGIGILPSCMLMMR